MPLSNPDLLSMFARGDLAGAWVPEPWGARLVAEAHGRILIDERTIVTPAARDAGEALRIFEHASWRP